MARTNGTGTRSTPQRRAPRGGIGWLVLLAIFGGALALVIFKPDLISGLFGGPGNPSDKGAPPISTSDVDANAGLKDVTIESKGFSGEAKDLSEHVSDRVPDLTTKVAVVENVGKADDAKALPLLDEATKAYHGYEWEEVQRTIRKLSQMDVSDGIRAKVAALDHNSKGLAHLFEKLGEDKEELKRNLETHPSLIFVQYQGNFAFYVPLRDMESETIITGSDPAGQFQAVLKRNKKAPVMNTRWIKVLLEQGNVGKVINADLDKIMTDCRQRFETNLGKLLASEDLRADPMAWYAAARYAYQNRLDDKVVELLEEAFIRDPDLATTIREDKASELYTAMVMHLENGNKQAAGAFKYKLEKQYKDTAIYAQAEAHYKGELDKLKQVREATAAKTKEKRQQANERRMEAAKQQKDEKKVEQIKQEQQVVHRYEQEMAAVTGDLGKGDDLFSKGETIYQRAVNMEACDARDGLYAQAQPYFEQAMAIYQKLGAEDKAATANQLRYACIKYRRPFH